MVFLVTLNETGAYVKVKQMQVGQRAVFAMSLAKFETREKVYTKLSKIDDRVKKILRDHQNSALYLD
jgi:hypothetical protein